MARVRTTLTVDEAVLRVLKARAARLGNDDSEVIEEALRRYLGLELVERLWVQNGMDKKSAVDLAVEAQHRTRPS